VTVSPFSAVEDPAGTRAREGVPEATAREASAAPVRASGVHSRAGNAMGRTRSALIDGAMAAIADKGARKTTMADIAANAGIAKGTLYNHFRTKEAVFDAVLAAAVDRLGEGAEKLAAGAGTAAALAYVARQLAESPVLGRLRHEPDALASVLGIDDRAMWARANALLRAVFQAGGSDVDPVGLNLAMRWLVSFLTTPDIDGIDLAAQRLADALRAGG